MHLFGATHMGTTEGERADYTTVGWPQQDESLLVDEIKEAWDTRREKIQGRKEHKKMTKTKPSRNAE